MCNCSGGGGGTNKIADAANEEANDVMGRDVNNEAAATWSFLLRR
jgi:hypothetical protein